jgi:hypothetical protein
MLLIDAIHESLDVEAQKLPNTLRKLETPSGAATEKDSSLEELGDRQPGSRVGTMVGPFGVAGRVRVLVRFIHLLEIS